LVTSHISISKSILLQFVFLALLSQTAVAQAVFQSAGSGGRWDRSASWTIVSGSDANGIPDADDQVTVLAGDVIEIRTNVACNNLTVIGTLDYGLNRTLSVGGNLTMSGVTAEIIGGNNKVLNVSGAFSVASGANVDLDISDLTVTGLTTLNGTLNFTQSHDHVFASIIVSSTGTWNNATISDFIINGNLTNNGGFTGCTNDLACEYYLNSSSGTISGSSVIKVPDFVINSPASYSNTGSIIITDNLDGTGTFVNSTSGTIEFELSTQTNISNFTASATGNTVIYNVGIDRDLINPTASTFYNLVINNESNLDDISLVSNITVTNQLTLTLGDLILGTNTLTLGSAASVSGGSANSYIQLNSTGVVRQNYVSTGGSVRIPLGDNNDYSPIISFVLSGGALGINPFVSFGVTDAVHPNRNTDNTGSGGDDDGTAAVSYLSRYWTVSGSNISDPEFTATYQYVDADVTGTESDMVAALRRTRTGGMGPVLDWKEAGTVNPTTNTVSLNSGDGFGDMYAMDNTDSRLPIVLLSFIAERSELGVKLKWVTTSEINNDFFTVERSVNGIDFEPILYVQGKGTSEETNTYETLDNGPLSGRSYYRLKQTDFNGAFDYSEVIGVNAAINSELETLVKIFPNAISPGDYLNIHLNKNGEEEIIVKLFTLEGIEILEIRKQTNEGFKVEIPTYLKSGIYILKIKKGRFLSSSKLVVE
tara:strand:- start:31698 stop:33821 length:2124 start_codon:yes stop_codon:yes gene_type:complete